MATLESEILQRTGQAEAPAVLRVDPKLWFEGGTVIFAAAPSCDTSSGMVHFKVHRDILCTHSPIFHDMFSIPSPVVRDQIDGIPLVILPDDAVDVQAFLRFIYIPTYEPRGIHVADYPVKMRGALKLAAKYEVEEFKRHILGRLREMWPHDLTAWDRRREMIVDEYNKKVDAAYDDGFEGTPDALGYEEIDFQPHSVVAMLRDAHCDEATFGTLRGVLGLAYYDLACYPERSLRIPSGTLTTDDFRHILHGRNKMLSCLTNYVNHGSPGPDSWHNPSSPRKHAARQVQCQDQSCTTARNAFWGHFWEHLCTSSNCIAFLARAQYKVECGWRFDSNGPKVCQSCATKIKAGLEKSREYVFGAIPTFFVV